MDTLYFLVSASALSFALSLRKRFAIIRESFTLPSRAHVTSLFVYPVKGCRAVSVSSCEITCTGLAFDRHWMIVSLDDEAPHLGRFVSQRECSRLAVIDATVFINGKENGEKCTSCFTTASSEDRVILRLSAPSMNPLDVPLIRESTRRVSIWKSTLTAFDQGDDVSEWLRDALSEFSSDSIPFDSSRLRLVYTDGMSRKSTKESTESISSRPSRLLSSSFLPFGSLWIGTYLIQAHDSVSFADGYPVLLTSAASLRDLNHRIVTRAVSLKNEERNVRDPFIGIEHPMNRFRSNIVCDGRDLVPWEEDSWLTFAVRRQHTPLSSDSSDTMCPLIMRGLKRCARCMVTTTDQNTGFRGTGDCEAREPLASLSTFRKSFDVNGGIMFGINVLFEWQEIKERKFRSERVISVGDNIVVIKRGKMPLE